MSNGDNQTLQAEINQLISTLKSLQLATLRPTGRPEASYSPFVYKAPYFYIFVSKLASHTDNLLKNPACGLLVIEDESKSANIHARKRLSLDCEAVQLDTAQPQSQSILNEMEVNLGKTVTVIKQLPDFCLFRLDVNGGRFIKGFGAAYRIGSQLDQIELIVN